MWSLKKISYEDSFAIIANAHDITDIRRRELDLKKARMDAEIASQSKSNFLANMSHEMRTPMNAIIGMTTIGKKSQSIEDKNHALNKIGDASSHLLGVINDVLDMAKIEADKLELSPIEYNFERVLQKVLTVVNFRVEEKEQQLTVNVDKNIPRFLIGDEQRLVQIITNLMSNAVKFTPEGGDISLNAFLVSENEGNCELRIEVTDSGIGISTEQKEKLFMAFEQADAGISRQYGGTGLGLTISKRIIELMGGKIWVESDLGKGAKFIFTMKAKRSDKFDSVNENLGLFDKDKEDNIKGGEFSGKNLLVAEDVEINREILISLLHDTGLSIDCAENGEEALKMVETAPDKYDIVFMDVQMPFMNGHEATRRIREFEKQRFKGKNGVEFAQQTPKLSERPKGVPIIALTANVFKSDIEDCLAAGMDDHLGKPLEIDRVIEKLRLYLK
ncbi:MAG: ATP-binding protein [Treponema sp.]|nr:ATP-binding protein [Treponema sp.]